MHRNFLCGWHSMHAFIGLDVVAGHASALLTLISNLAPRVSRWLVVICKTAQGTLPCATDASVTNTVERCNDIITDDFAAAAPSALHGGLHHHSVPACFDEASSRHQSSCWVVCYLPACSRS
jgi:hypothetical protein